MLEEFPRPKKSPEALKSWPPNRGPPQRWLSDPPAAEHAQVSGRAIGVPADQSFEFLRRSRGATCESPSPTCARPLGPAVIAPFAHLPRPRSTSMAARVRVRHELFQQPQPLARQVVRDRGESRDVSARPRQACDETQFDRIGVHVAMTIGIVRLPLAARMGVTPFRRYNRLLVAPVRQQARDGAPVTLVESPFDDGISTV